MPTYEYLCEKCDRIDEIMHSIKEDPEIKCPECDIVMRRLISGGAAIIFAPGFPGRDNKVEKRILDHIPEWQKRGEKPPPGAGKL